jgi:hypothetical protein
VLVKHDGPRVSTTLLTPDGASSRLLVTWKVRYRGQLSGDPTWYSLRWGRSDAFAVYDDDVSCGRTAIFRVDVATTAKTQLTHPC